LFNLDFFFFRGCDVQTKKMSSVERVMEIVRSTPPSDTLYLEYLNLEDLASVLPIVASFKGLRRLYLYGNRLTFIPDNISELESLETLDLSNNPISDINALIPGLSSLPSLKHLILPAHSPRDAEMLVAHLPRLETLNGEGILLRSVGMFGGTSDPLMVVPPSAQGQSGQGARTYADEGAGQTGVDGDAAGEDDAQDDGADEEPGLTGDDLGAVAVLYDSVRTFSGGATQEELTSRFDDHVHAVLAKMQTRLDGVSDPYIRRAELLAAKHALYDVCFTGTRESDRHGCHRSLVCLTLRCCAVGTVERAETLDPVLADVLRRLRRAHSEVWIALPSNE
jgi:hypothetical protein